MIEIILAFGWAFWLVAAIAVGLALVGAVNNSVSTYVIAIIAGTAALLFVSGNLGNAWVYIQENPVSILQWFMVYVGIGVLYAVIRMYSYLSGLRMKFLDYRAKVYGRDNDTPMTPDDMKNFKREAGIEYKSFPPRISDYKGSIMDWMVMWPFCWVELRPLTKLFSFIYNSIAGGLQSMSDRMFRDLA